MRKNKTKVTVGAISCTCQSVLPAVRTVYHKSKCACCSWRQNWPIRARANVDDWKYNMCAKHRWSCECWTTTFGLGQQFTAEEVFAFLLTGSAKGSTDQILPCFTAAWSTVAQFPDWMMPLTDWYPSWNRSVKTTISGWFYRANSVCMLLIVLHVRWPWGFWKATVNKMYYYYYFVQLIPRRLWHWCGNVGSLFY